MEEISKLTFEELEELSDKLEKGAAPKDTMVVLCFARPAGNQLEFSSILVADKPRDEKIITFISYHLDSPSNHYRRYKEK